MTDIYGYFGRPGNLSVLVFPKGGTDGTRERQVSVFALGDGGAHVDKTVGGARQWTLNYSALTRDAFATLQAFAEGLEGPGPFAYLDPSLRNMLLANQAGATSVYNDTTNFTVAGTGCTIASSTAFTDAGPRVLAWTFNNTAPASASLTGAPASAAFSYGVPVKASRSLCFSCQARGGGTDAIVTLTPQLRWYDTSGALLSTSSGTAFTTASGAWSAASGSFVAAVPPADAAYVNWSLAASAASVTAGAVVYLRRLQLEEGTAPGTWYPGTGVWPVQVVSLVDSWPMPFPELKDGPVFVLQEDTG